MKKIPDKKLCSICRKYKKTKEDFSPCKAGRYGFYNYCKECRNKRNLSLNPDREIIDEKRARKVGLKKLGLKTCSSCGDIKNIKEDFYDDPRHSDGKWSQCKECCDQKNAKVYIKNQYGIGKEEYDKLMKFSNGTCFICGRRPKKNKFNIDHCHKTNLIRGLLCVNCNTNLVPLVERFPEWIKKAFDYVANPPAFDIIGKLEVPETNLIRKGRKSNWYNVGNSNGFTE